MRPTEPAIPCELPPEVRTELTPSKRPRILGRTKPVKGEQSAKVPFYFVLLCARRGVS